MLPSGPKVAYQVGGNGSVRLHMERKDSCLPVSGDDQIKKNLPGMSDTKWDSSSDVMGGSEVSNLQVWAGPLTTQDSDVTHNIPVPRSPD